ncbi:hypothetical protein ACTFIY_010203 [Dictyostelium cf. discoideum]
MAGFTYITPQQIVDSLISIYGKENIGLPKNITPTDEKGNSTFDFEYFGVNVTIKFNDKYGMITVYPMNRFLETFVNTYNRNQDPERKDKTPIFITPEIIADSLKEIYGEKFSLSNVENNDEKIKFSISFFEQQLNVVLCKVTGNVVSFPRNDNLIEFIIELNSNYSRSDETSKLPKRTALSIENMSKKQIIRPGCTLKPSQVHDALIAKFGAENVTLFLEKKVKSEVGQYQIDLVYFGIRYLLILDPIEGVKLTPEYEPLANFLLEVQVSSNNSGRTEQNKIITPKQIVDNFNNKFGASNVSEPQSIIDNGNGNFNFKINFFGQDLNVTLNNGQIETEPKNENFIMNVLKQIREMN